VEQADKPSEHVLNDGTKVTVRTIRPSDADMLRAGFERLSPESRYRRFFSSISVLTDEAVRYLTDVDSYNHVAIVAVVDSLDLKVEDGLGVARFIRLEDDPEIAEAAVTVTDHAQRKGLGRVLLSVLIDKARAIGVKRFRAEVLRENEPMMKLLLGAGATMHRTSGPTVIFDVPIEGATQDSAEEASLVERVLRAAASSLTVFLRTLRPPQSEAELAEAPRSVDSESVTEEAKEQRSDAKGQ